MQFEATNTNFRNTSQLSELQSKHLLRHVSLEVSSTVLIENSIKISRGFSLTNCVQISTSCFKVIIIRQTVMIKSKTASDGHFKEPRSKISISLSFMDSSGSNNGSLSAVRKSKQSRQF